MKNTIVLNTNYAMVIKNKVIYSKSAIVLLPPPSMPISDIKISINSQNLTSSKKLNRTIDNRRGYASSKFVAVQHDSRYYFCYYVATRV